MGPDKGENISYLTSPKVWEHETSLDNAERWLIGGLRIEVQLYLVSHSLTAAEPVSSAECKLPRGSNTMRRATTRQNNNTHPAMAVIFTAVTTKLCRVKHNKEAASKMYMYEY